MTNSIELIHTSFQKMCLAGESVIASVYDHLFETYPETRPFFDHILLEDQRYKLLMTLVLVIDHLDDPDTTATLLRRLGSIHADHCVHTDHFVMFGDSFLHCLAQYFGEGWSPELAAAWTETYQHVVETMLHGQLLAP